jgi:4-alpha-glucanotransferase
MSLLNRVADAYGIITSFKDAAGVPRTASPETVKALLAVMGVDAGSEAGQREALRRTRAAAALPPTLTLRAGEDAAIPLPAVLRRHGWRLELEDGETLEGGASQPSGPDDKLLLPAPLPMGYHRLLVEQPAGEPLTSVLVASPERCVVPRDLGIERCFGIGAQAYSLRSERDLGSGDLADLTAFAEVSGREGADFLALNPLHALFFSTPANRSPYAPSHRRFLNWLLIAPDKVPELEGDPELEAARADARGDDPHLIDYPATAARRRRLLEAGFARFKEQHLGSRPTPRGAAFETFRKADGQGLERHCLFEAMHEQVLAEGKAFAWWEWPEGWRDPQSAEARAFAERHRDRVDFFAWLQWLADSQLGEAQDRAKAAGMRIGLYRDLAVGVDPAGSLTWSFPEVAVRGATVGAPPDIYNPKGQNWGIAPLAPEALARAGFGPWIGDIRGNMRHAGALRIDHAMGLRRLYWIPQGAEPGEGAYVRYPFATMAAILALESHRSQCLVLGEDLGTVPPGFRPAMNRAGILSCRVLYFERTGSGGYTAPAAYPEAAVASVSTHDLATLKGWLAAHDLGWRERLDLFVEEGQAEAARADRELDAMRLIRTLRRAGLLAPRSEPDAETLALAVHRWLARTPSALVLVQLEDLELSPEQVNLPGTIDEHPNWRRRTTLTLADLLTSPFAKALLAALREERPRG